MADPNKYLGTLVHRPSIQSNLTPTIAGDYRKQFLVTTAQIRTHGVVECINFAQRFSKRKNIHIYNIIIVFHYLLCMPRCHLVTVYLQHLNTHIKVTTVSPLQGVKFVNMVKPAWWSRLSSTTRRMYRWLGICIMYTLFSVTEVTSEPLQCHSRIPLKLFRYHVINWIKGLGEVQKYTHHAVRIF